MRSEKFLSDYYFYSGQKRHIKARNDLEGTFKYVLENSTNLIDIEKKILEEMYLKGYEPSMIAIKEHISSSTRVHRMRVVAMNRIWEEFGNIFDIGLEQYLQEKSKE